MLETELREVMLTIKPFDFLNEIIVQFQCFQQRKVFKPLNSGDTVVPEVQHHQTRKPLK